MVANLPDPLGSTWGFGGGAALGVRSDRAGNGVAGVAVIRGAGTGVVRDGATAERGVIVIPRGGVELGVEIEMPNGGVGLCTGTPFGGDTRGIFCVVC